MYICRGNHKDAVNSYKAATDITEDNPQAFMRLGNCLFSLDRYTEAESAFRRGLEVSLNPLLPSAYRLSPTALFPGASERAVLHMFLLNAWAVNVCES